MTFNLSRRRLVTGGAALAALGAINHTQADAAPLPIPPGAPFLAKNSLPEITNFDPAKLPYLRAALNRVRTGSGDMVVNFYGHSAIAGVGVATSSPYSNGAFPFAPSAAFAKRLTALGIPTRQGSWFGSANIPGAISAYDTRRSYTAAWAPLVSLSNGNMCPGGTMILNSTTTGEALSFAPSEAWDTLNTYSAGYTGGGTFTLDVGGTVKATQSTNASLSLITTTFTTSRATQTVNLKNTILGNGNYIVGQETIDSTTPSVRVRNMGFASATSGQLAGQVNPFNPLSGLQALGGDLTIFCGMRNDQALGISPSTFQTNMQTMITAAKAFGDVILLHDHAPTTWTYTNDAQFTAAIYALGAANNIPVFDIPNRISIAQAVAQGYFAADGIHYNAKGWSDIGSWLANVIIGQI